MAREEDMRMTVLEALAEAMFRRRCELDAAAPEMVAAAWAEDDVQRFWFAEAEHVLEVLDALQHEPLGADR